MKIFLSLLVLLIYGICNGQNLIPNASFEDTVSCPIGIGQVSLATGWSEFSISPDYLNLCNTSTVGTSFAGVPDNMFGNQNARTGNAYVGMYTYLTFGANAREVPGIQLTQTLAIGQKYYVKMFISRARNLAINMKLNIATNKFGARFSTIPFSFSNETPINNFAHVYSDSVVEDTTNWTLISGSFIADSAYNYVAFGNFFSDSNTIRVYYDTTSVNAYYYLDDVSVSTDSSYTMGVEEQNHPKIVFFPNPFNDKLSIQVNNFELSEIVLYNIISEVLFQQSFTNSITLNTAQLGIGIYFYEVRNKNGNFTTGKLIKQ